MQRSRPGFRAVQTGDVDPRVETHEEHAVEPDVAGDERGVTLVGIERHALALARAPDVRWPFSDMAASYQ